MQVIHTYLPVKAVKSLIKNQTEGFSKLCELNRLDLAVENLVLKDKYKHLFSKEDREICYNRLQDAGYKINISQNELDC